MRQASLNGGPSRDEPVEIGVERLALQRRRGAGQPRRILPHHLGIGAAEPRLAPGELDQAGAVLDQGRLAEGDRPRLAPRLAEAEGAVQPGEQGGDDQGEDHRQEGRLERGAQQVRADADAEAVRR